MDKANNLELMIHEEICTYEVCKLAKEKGFPQHIGNDAYIVDNEYDDKYEVECYYPIQFIPDYLPTITAPTQSLLQRWLRKEKRIEVNAFWDSVDGIWFSYAKKMDIPESVVTFMPDEFFISYESAIEDALKYALGNLV